MLEVTIDLAPLLHMLLNTKIETPIVVSWFFWLWRCRIVFPYYPTNGEFHEFIACGLFIPKHCINVGLAQVRHSRESGNLGAVDARLRRDDGG